MGTDTSVWSATASASRLADALLRAQGGSSVALRMPAVSADASDGAQLGLSTQGFQDLALSPAVFRKARATSKEGDAASYELLVSATAVSQVVGEMQLDSADALFAQAMAVVMGGKLFLIESVTSSVANGKAYLYRLLLRAGQPQAQ